MLIVNFFGAPGSGKSTAAHALFYLFKKLGDYKVEFMPEPCKLKAYDDHLHIDFKTQLPIIAAYLREFERLKDKVDILILDGSLLLGYFYTDSQLIQEFITELYRNYDNYAVYVPKLKSYSALGRNQSELEADELRETMKTKLEYLIQYELPDLELDAIDNLRIHIEIKLDSLMDKTT